MIDYACVYVVLPLLIANQNVVHGGMSHPLPQPVAALTCQSSCCNGAKDLELALSGKMEHKKKQTQKRKGGAEKLRDKKKKSFEKFASTSKKITDLFGGRSGGPSLSSGESQRDFIELAPESRRKNDEPDFDTAEL